MRSRRGSPADNLTPSARLRVSQILGGDAFDLMVLDSNWADEVHSDRPETSGWHYVNIEIGARGYDRRRDCPRDNCVVRQIERDIGLLRDPRASRAARLGTIRSPNSFRGRPAPAASCRGSSR